MRNARRKALRCAAAFSICLLWCVAAASCGGDSGPGDTGTTPPTGTGTQTVPPTGTGPGGAIGVDLIWCTKQKFEQSWIDSFKNKLVQSNEVMWNGFEGQHYMRKITLNNPGDDGDVLIETRSGVSLPDGSGGYTWWNAPPPQGTPGFIGLPGGYYLQSWLHEWDHFHFAAQYVEEYDCYPCAMSAGGGSPVLKYCDKSNCQKRAGPDPCWDNHFLKKYPSWKHPNTPSGSVPTVEITVFE